MVDILFSYKTLKKVNRWLHSLWSSTSTLSTGAVDLLNNKALTVDLSMKVLL